MKIVDYIHKTSFRHNSKIWKLISVFAAVAIVGLVGWYIFTRDIALPADSSGEYVIFEGTVTDRNNGCSHDGICSVTVDNKVIVTRSGLTNNSEANVYGVIDADLASGDHVQVKALNTKNARHFRGVKSVI